MQVNARQRRRKLAQIDGGRADLTGELAEAPMRWRDRRVRSGQDQGQAFWIGAAGFDVDERRFDHARPAAFGPVADRAGQFIEGQIALVGRAGEPFGRHSPDTLAAADIDLVAAAHVTAGAENLHVHGINLHDGRRKSLSQHSTRHKNPFRTLTLRGRCVVSPQKGSAETWRPLPAAAHDPKRTMAGIFSCSHNCSAAPYP